MVIGVVHDFNYLSLHDEVKPMMFHMFGQLFAPPVFVRLRPGKHGGNRGDDKVCLGRPCAGTAFFNTNSSTTTSRAFTKPKRWSSIVGYAGMLAVALACLGLFGLVALAAVNRTKEIGIRKVLGATVGNITTLLSRDFLKLILLAILIATPLAWYAMDK
ncbi:MAG: hypothetical protein IPK76_01345 [Lewinellaceae bacterium]|nr:hypothetical protein [Lewinellaceae bacterium]